MSVLVSSHRRMENIFAVTESVT